MNGIALITGASAGIGRCIAETLAEKGHPVIITGRRKDRLEELAQEITGAGGKVLPLIFDVRDRNQVEDNLGSLPDPWKEVEILVNNAGLAVGLKPVHEGDPDDWNRMIDTNVKGVLYVSRQIIPGMIERRTGHIINVSSIAAKEVYPNGNVYCGTKQALDAITHSMRMELLQHCIRVTSIHPGMAETEFSLVRFKGDAERADKVYENIDALQPEDVAASVVWCISQPPHVNIQELTIMPSAQASVRMIRLRNGVIR